MARNQHEHSIYTMCWHCHSWGINLPGNTVCGDCGSDDTTIYYPLKDKWLKRSWLDRKSEGICNKAEIKEIQHGKII